MVLILTHEQDVSTRGVIRWLDYLGKEVIVFHKERDWINIKDIDYNKGEVLFESKNYGVFALSNIEAVFCRGGIIRIKDYVKHPGQYENFKTSLQYFLSAHSISHLEAITHFLFEKNTIGQNGVGRYNKMLALNLAKKVGLDIPHTIFTDSKEKALSFCNEHDEIITKSLDLNFMYQDTRNAKRFFEYTAIITKADIEGLPTKFGLTIFQEKINKQYEIRVFYLKEKLYCFAIFSQKNKKTQVDYRCYDRERMNRMIPFQLPLDVGKKVSAFMKKAKLDTGSIDLIYGLDKKFHFLEVNPIGQFGYLSNINNYKIEKQIALALIN
ncbi:MULTISPECIES: grasp-with-spasm system ATP-grasp peptide maturase [unclassified Aureispira]|uniref:grasp-with-spasm system ATP-grasp peptide maturase n=1 Tax=unclassified Aureispira TaxID=2649989 RepID=UPI0006975730|nr:MULTISPECIES: grasp-with-spasm system ATP-grasp peptide maturase [unclassified Aureispira]WMX14515.1 grasp-with-spasm system ATP-grasp peptide maturase [Aureispira sp. CCB-E]